MGVLDGGLNSALDGGLDDKLNGGLDGGLDGVLDEWTLMIADLMVHLYTGAT